jgi:murein DD-endopeptidase MepM/ murein hydrolase activator NlpD
LRRKKSGSSLGVLVLFALIIGGALYIYNSSMFERDLPEITMENNGYWNLKNPLKIDIEDASGLKSYKIVLKNNGERQVLQNEQFITPESSLHVEVAPPKSAYAMKNKNIIVSIEATDASKWNLLNGNSVRKEFKLKIDKKRPQLSNVANSYKIKKGGAALVIFRAKDDNLKDIYIQTNFGKKFHVTPFYKEGYYISLLAWPVTERNFRATIVATDEAQNVSKIGVPLYIKDKAYRISKIKLSEKFLQGKIAELAEEFVETQGVSDSIDQFKIINEDVRKKNEDLIHELTSKVPTEMVSDFKLHKMYPLKNAAIVARFGDHRLYYYNGEKVSESYHLGLDMASNAMAKIRPQNSGDIIFADYNGLYGNMPLIHHGLGLYTLYGHCSSLLVASGDSIRAKAHIANTGKSGYAMGDHLHFGVLIQGVEVRPAEWMDSQWMELNIGNVIKDAKEIIDRG